ncbi:MFS transporter [Paenibacillus sp. BC26]|uniref:MFS transporter n=1 Tax=Paenibacillus sp. BC26 TaxID=1881032 RepID=UPI0008ED80C3|nr:MFS transporter [Paenibacillus sp. BC26]SFS74962.1 Major Facilitator Superfamily protein [Paenibacillus sp. BC26]
MTKTMRLMMLSQSMMTFGSGIVFPFYLIFVKEIGGDFTQYGIAYGLFTLCSAYLNWWFGKSSDKYGRKIFLLLSAWGTAVLFLLFPIVSSIWQVYALQIAMGAFGAMQRTCEKALLADLTEEGRRGEQIGRYHVGVSVFSGIAVMAGGFLIDLFTLDLMFYLGSIILFVSGLMLSRVNEGQRHNST